MSGKVVQEKTGTPKVVEGPMAGQDVGVCDGHW